LSKDQISKNINNKYNLCNEKRQVLASKRSLWYQIFPLQGKLDRGQSFLYPKDGMKKSLIALLLSALVFPGIGQIYKGKTRKGIFLILAASMLLAVLILGFFILYSYAYAAILSQAASPEAVSPAQLRLLLFNVITHPFILFIFGLLLATWVYGVVDAVRRTS
jgi:TM2 domain-containing membrane protein YozV